MMRSVFELEPTTRILSTNSYIVSYPYLLSYFSGKTTIEPEDVVRGAHMAYGWMPTILDLYPDPAKIDLAGAAELLAKARQSGTLSDTEIGQVAALVNNSLVGASKLLHFVAPNSFAMWDSKIYTFVFNERPHNYRVSQVANYRKYLALLATLQQDPRFPLFHNSVSSKVGYTVSPIRALELVMFLNSPATERATIHFSEPSSAGAELSRSDADGQ